jgi:hypothetical protein
VNLNADEIKFRASSMGNLMTEPRSKSELVGETAKTELCKAFAFYRAGIQEQIESKYFEKGHKREELGITYYSAVLRQKLQKNETRLFDDVCTGLPDLYMGKDIHSAEIIPDIKNAWSYVSYLKTITQPIAKDRYWQGQTYMRLTGAKEAHFVICCVNAPLEMIMDERRRAMFKMGISEEDDPAYIEKCLSIERSMIMDLAEFKKEYPYAELYSEAIKEVKESFINIPWEQRIHVMKVLRNDSDIKAIEDKAPIWRKYIQDTFINKKED